MSLNLEKLDRVYFIMVLRRTEAILRDVQGLLRDEKV